MKPTFIVGNGRSGTTMIGEMLTELGLGKSFESQFLIDIFGELSSEALSPKEVLQLYDKVMRHQSAQRFNLTQELFEVEGTTPVAQLVDSLFTHVAQQSGQAHWIDKTPFYIFHLTSVRTIFPDAKFIWCVRDGRDVGLSVMKKSWGANNIYSAAKNWVRANYDNTGLSEISPENLLLVKYEEFLSDPQHNLARIIEFIGEDVPSSKIAEVTQKVKAQNFNKWESELSLREKSVFEAIAFDCLQKFGYPTTFSSKPTLSRPARAYYAMDDRIRLAMHLIRMNLVAPLKIALGLQKPFDETN